MRNPTIDPGWSPPHCPNRKCRHHNDLPDRWHYVRRGYFTRPSDGLRVPRAQCRACGVTFSRQTFSIDYWMKRRDLPRRVFMRIVGGMCGRQIARDVGCSPEAVHRVTARLGRHCMLFHMAHWRSDPPTCPVVVDGFESFEYSQYHPIHHHLAVEAETGFWLYHTDSELRRKGRMTSFQKKRRAELEAMYGRPDPRAIRKDMTQLLEVSLDRSERAHIHSDDHRSYPPAIRAAPCPVRHTVTSSKIRRTTRNPLFPVNELDLLIRHSQSNHKRETIAFSKRRQASAERLAILQVWKNYVKWWREKRPGETAAMRKGIANRRLTIGDVLAKRLFRGRIGLPPRWSEYYDRAVQTREISRNRRHTLSYAY